MLTNTYVCEVEFLGGPIDGHLESLVLPLHTYVGVKVLWNTDAELPSSSLLRSTQGTAATRIAIYQLDNTRSRVSYRFLRTQLLSDQSRANDVALNSLIEDDRPRD
jgi:hypothetical protein